MKEIKIIDGNIFDCTENIICHQTNCQGVMGHGIALQVKNRFPMVYHMYNRYCIEMADDKRSMLGEALILMTDLKENKYIANIFGQLNFGEGLQTDYDRLKHGLEQVHTFAKNNSLSVAIPYKIGCGLANGDWDTVYKSIQEVFCDDVPVTIYRYERNERY